ncbi:hypothetical protein ABTX82_33025 [Streptomyces lavendulae]|uniref:hypothetical protein n=1 Tax=Streptomyces lavendulae TaxID=1914 RepID=UPI00332A6400
MGELHVRGRGQCQGEITYAVHPRVRGQGVATAVGEGLLARGSRIVGSTASMPPATRGTPGRQGFSASSA